MPHYKNNSSPNIEEQINALTDTLALHSIADADNFEDFLIIESDDEEYLAERKVLREFAIGEHLAHNLAYANLKTGDCVDIKAADQSVDTYKTFKLKTGQGGVVIKAFVPVNKKNATVHLSFTGTNSFAALHADLERNAGEEAIYKRGNMDNILKQINKIVEKVHNRSGQEVHLTFAGHSLGGALAGQTIAAALGRRATNMIDNKSATKEECNLINNENEKLKTYFKSTYDIELKAVAKEDREYFDKVGSFNLSTWNKTGESRVVADYSNTMANLIVSKQGKMSVKARFGMVAGDSVQQTGENTVLSDCDGEISVMKVDIGLEKHAHRSALMGLLSTGTLGLIGGVALGPVAGVAAGSAIGMIYLGNTLKNALSAHTAHHFKDGVDMARGKLRYELTHNSTKEGKLKIKERLQKKSSLLQTKVLLVGKSALHKIGRAFGSSAHRNKAMDQEGVNISSSTLKAN